jgi:hypothetical protein
VSFDSQENDEFDDESGEAEGSEQSGSDEEAQRPGYEAGFEKDEGSEENMYGDEIADEGDEALGNMDTNIHSKRDEAISNLLSKDDLGIINMRIKETTKIL